MDIYSFIYLYIFCGLLMSLWILLYPFHYVESLRYSVIILKTVSLKLKAKQEDKPPLKPKELKQQQSEYVQTFDTKIKQDSESIQKNPVRFNFTILLMIFGWVLIIFIFALAFVLKHMYLEPHELP